MPEESELTVATIEGGYLTWGRGSNGNFWVEVGDEDGEVLTDTVSNEEAQKLARFLQGEEVAA